MSNDQNERPGALSRRGFLTGGAAAMGGGVALAGLGAGPALAEPAPPAAEVEWDIETDIVVIGAGAAGLPAAVAAADEGAEVIIVEHHFDIGGMCILSGGDIRIGGGNRLQREAGIEDDADAVFARWIGPGLNERFNDRELVRRFADENVDTFDFLERHGVNFGRPHTEVPNELFVGITQGGYGVRPREWPIRTDSPVVDQGRNGSGIVRPLEHAARDMGVRFLLSHTLRDIVREEPFAGPVLGVRIEEVDRWFEPLHRFLNIRARRGVILCNGGHGANVHFRRMFDPRLTEEYQWAGQATAPVDAAGEIAAMKHGAALWATANETSPGTGNAVNKGRLAVRDNYIRALHDPDHSPVFFRQRASGLTVSNWQNLILVKENGLRFWNELDSSHDGYFARAMDWTGDPNKMNGGGPIWAVFDAAAVEREGWSTDTPAVDRAGGYFFSADTLEELAAQIIHNHYQWRPMPGHVLAETVERFNGFVDSGEDEDFGRPGLPYKIEQPPFFAAWATPILHDSYTGLRTDTNCQVVDLWGELIPGLYCAGESQGGFRSHGLGRCVVTGRIAGMEAARAG